MKKYISIVILCFSISFSFAQSPQLPTALAYQRAENFSWSNLSQHIYHSYVRPQWFEDGSGFAYSTRTRNGEKYYTVLFHAKEKRPSFDQQRLADALSQALHDKVLAKKLSLNYLHWQDKDHFSFYSEGKAYKVNLENYQITPVVGKKNRDFDGDHEISPNGKEVVYTRGGNLFLENSDGTNVRQLSSNGNKLFLYGSDYGWGDVMVGEDKGPVAHLFAQWSPDGKKILTQILDARKGEKMYLLNWSIDTMYRPVLLSYYRASPGDSNDVDYVPIIFDAQTGKMSKIDLPALPHYLGVNLRWTQDGKHLYGLYYHRGYKQMDVIEVDPETGKVRTVFTDSSKTYVESNTQFRYIEKKNIAIISSEKSGWNQLYLVNWKTGKTQPITNGNFVVKDIISVDVDNDFIYFTASGKEENINPYYNFLYKIKLNGGDLQLLTPEALNHEITLSPDKKYFVDNCSSATSATKSLLRSTSNDKLIIAIDSADILDILKMGWRYPQIFTATARDGKTTIYGALWKPTNFDKNIHYPLIDYSYTGAQTNVFPNTFSKALYSFYASAQSLAELGFIVMQVDGLGSSGRSKSFHDWSYRNMGNNLADHVLAIRQLGKRFNWIDTTRVGIYGHSAGGYDAAHALLAFNNCYKVAVAESGDHDWRMEKAWWPEMYVGWPVDSIYQEESNITLAPKLKGKLLLIHGGIDENVNPSETFKLSEALIKAGKYFDLLIIPSAHHGYPNAYIPYVDRKRWDYFVNNLIIKK